MTRLAWLVGTTVSATTSVRDCVVPLARKNRRRTDPTATSSLNLASSGLTGGSPPTVNVPAGEIVRSLGEGARTVLRDLADAQGSSRTASTPPIVPT